MKLLRPPSVEDYARMTQQMRLNVAQILAAQLDEIEARRTPEPRRYMAEDYSPEDTRIAARFLARRYAEEYPDSPAVKAARLSVAVGEAFGRPWDERVAS